MTTGSTVKCTCLVAWLAVAACEGADDPMGASDTESEQTGGDGSCDPVGVDAQMGELLNAPLLPDVEVIVKQPQHPGPPGPTDLP